MLIIHAPDLNSYSKLMKKAQAAGIYVLLVDNPANFPADAFVGSDWDRLGQLEAEAAIKGCGENSSKKIGLVQGDQANSSSLYQYAGIMKVLAKHPDFQVVAKPDSNWDATTSRNVDDDDAAAESRHLRASSTSGTATPRAPRRRSATPSSTARSFLVTTGGGEKAADCDKLQDGTYGAVVMTELHDQSGDMNAIIKFLLQSGQPAGTSHDLHLHAGEGDDEGRPQARQLLGPEGAAGRGGGEVSQSSSMISMRWPDCPATSFSFSLFLSRQHPTGAATTTTPAGKVNPGKLEKEKTDHRNHVSARHGICSYSYTLLLERHAHKSAQRHRSQRTSIPTYICSMPKRLAHRTRQNNGVLKIVCGIMRLSNLGSSKLAKRQLSTPSKLIALAPQKKKPVKDYIAGQGRFRHLFTPQNQHVLDEMQRYTDEHWARLQLKCEQA